MKNISILYLILRLLSPMAAGAQGVTIHTKDGNMKDYPAGTFTHITPFRSGDEKYGIDVWTSDGNYDRYMEGELKEVNTYQENEQPGAHTHTTVTPTGGKLTMGNLTVDMPAGTFKGDTKVTATEAKKGFIDGDEELSEYYKVHFTDGVRKGFKVSVAMPKIDDDELVRMQFAVMGWAPSLGEERMVRHYVDVTYENGAYVADIPEMESPDDVNEIDVWFGVTKCNPTERPAGIKALSRGTVRNDYQLYKYTLAFGSDELTDIVNMLDNIWIGDAMNKIEDLGFAKEDGSYIEFYLMNMGEDIGGCATHSPWGKKYSEVYLNYTKISKLYKDGDIDDLRGTIIHEVFHYYQQFYDWRSAPRHTWGGHSTATILDEASSVWSEKTYSSLPSVMRENISVFIPSINPDHKDVVAATNAQLKWSERFQNVGYGAAALLEYLTQKCGKQIILEMWEDRKTSDPFETRDRIERLAKKHGIDIFTQETYHDFIEMLGCKQLYKGEDMGFSDLVNLRERHDSIGVLKRIIANTKPVYFTNYVYGYGALVEELVVSANYGNDNMHGLDCATGVIEQTMEGFTTWVYRSENRGNYIPCGVIKKGTSLKIQPEWFYKVGEYYRDVRMYFVTIPDDFKMEGERLSRIVARVLTLDTPVKQASLPADEGHKEFVMKSNYTDLSVKPSDNWLLCGWYPDENTVRIYYEELPSGTDTRKASVQIMVPSDDGPDILLDEIEVTQLKAFIDLSDAEVEVPVNGETKTVSITSTNCTDLKVSTTSTFLHPTISGTTISVKVDANSSIDSREGIVTVSGVMKSYNIPVERRIHFKQAGTVSPEPIELYNNGFISVSDDTGMNRVNIPGQTSTYGSYLRYTSSDTQVEKTSSSRTEYSWNVEIYIDPKDNKSMRHYEFYSGSVTWLRNEYWTEKDNNGNTTEHQSSTRCSYNLKNLTTTDGLDFYSLVPTGTEMKLSDFVTDYSYQFTRDGKTVTTYTQTDIEKKDGGTWSIRVQMSLADGVPYLEADRDSVYGNGSDGFDIIRFTKNEVVQKVEASTSDNWLRIDNFYSQEYGGSFYLYSSVNDTKEPRDGHVYITGTMADGSKLTRTIVVRQEYDPIWDDNPDETETQKAELPSEDVLTALASAGMPLYLGSNPPKLNGTYKMEPLTTVYETDGESGSVTGVDNLVFRLTSLSGSDNRANMSYYSHMTSSNKNTTAADYLCYLGGYDNCFTLSNITTYDLEFYKFSYVTMVSGEIEEGKVKNLHFASVELDEDGTVISISIGTDGDGISIPTTWEPGQDEEY